MRIGSLGGRRIRPDFDGIALAPGDDDPDPARGRVEIAAERAPLPGKPGPRPRELGYLLLSRSCRALIDSGVTTIRDVGSNDDEAIVMRRAVELGLVDGPRILSCGRIVSATSPGGRMFGTMYSEADGPWNLRQAVRAQLRLEKLAALVD